MKSDSRKAQHNSFAYYRASLLVAGLPQGGGLDERPPLCATVDFSIGNRQFTRLASKRSRSGSMSLAERSLRQLPGAALAHEQCFLS